MGLTTFAGLGGIASIGIGSFWFRLSRGKPVFPHPPRDATFMEASCSGRSRRNFASTLIWVRSCLLVYIQNRELVVTLEFPFTLMFLPEVSGLEMRVPLTSISSVEAKRPWPFRILRITFDAGGPAPIELRMQRERDFVRALGTGIEFRGRRIGFPNDRPITSRRSPTS